MTNYHRKPDYNGMRLHAESMVEFFSSLIASAKESSAEVTDNGIETAANHLYTVLYDHYMAHARHMSVANPTDIWKRDTKIQAILIGDADKVFVWDIVFTVPSTGKSFRIQSSSADTSSHVPMHQLMLVVQFLEMKKRLKMVTQVSAPIYLQWTENKI